MDTDQEIELQEEAPVDEKPETKEAAPEWATSMAAAMRSIADKVSQPGAPQRQGLSESQIKEINDRLTKSIVENNPLGAFTPLANEVANDRINAFRGELAPYVQAAVDTFIDRFRSTKKEDAEDKGQLKLYREVNKQFEKELEGEDLSSLASRTPAERNKFFDKAWRAAQGEVLSKRVVAKPASRPDGASGSGGSGGGGSSRGGGGTGVKLSEVEKRQLYRSMSKEKADQYIKEIEESLGNE